MLDQDNKTNTELPQRADKLRILLAEDNFINQRVGMRQLEKLGAHVEVVANGQEVLDLLAQKQFDIIFMDLSMPVMDGIEATEKILAQFDQPPYIVALTANAMEKDRIASLEAGMQDFLPKPITVTQISRALDRYLAHVA